MTVESAAHVARLMLDDLSNARKYESGSLSVSTPNGDRVFVLDDPADFPRVRSLVEREMMVLGTARVMFRGKGVVFTWPRTPHSLFAEGQHGLRAAADGTFFWDPGPYDLTGSRAVADPTGALLALQAARARAPRSNSAGVSKA
jgi:hypothetical protein